MPLPESLEFGLLKLAFGYQFLLLPFSQFSSAAQVFAPFLGLAHHGTIIAHFLVPLFFAFLQLRFQCHQFGRLSQEGNAVVDVCDARFSLFKLPMRLQQVIYRRHKVVVAVAAAQVTRKCCKKPQLAALVPNHEYPHHFPPLQFFVPLVACGEIAAHFLSCPFTQPVGDVVKRKRELSGQGNGGDVL